MIKINNVSVSFKEQVLEAITCDFLRDDVNVIIGPNGSGKSTLLKAILGECENRSGEISIDGHQVGPIDSIPIGFATPVFQEPFLWPTMTVRANIYLPVKDVNSFEEDRVAKIIKEVGVDNILDKYPHQLSSGQKQLVALARAITVPSKFFLFDEATANLDTANSEHVGQIIKKLNNESGAGIVLISHQIGLARKIGDRYFFLDDGRLLASGNMSEIDGSTNANLRQFLEYA